METFYHNSDINILVTDDNSQNIQIIGQILLENNYNVSFATSGYEALSLLNARNDFDLILLDIIMPSMSGFDVCKKIKASEKYKHIPIIFLTAKSETESVIEGFHLGANDYIIKPFNADELLLRVKTQIDLKKQREELQYLNQKLEDKVKEKTFELQTANEKLGLLEKSKSEFLKLISHEMRTPLNIINGFIEILTDALQSTQHIHDLKILKSSTDKLISLAETALLITEIQLGKYTLEFEKVNIDMVCQKAANHCELVYADRNLEYHTNFQQGQETVSGDFNLVLNIITKITENAILACKGNCNITYDFRTENNYQVLEVKDNGPGFSDEDLSKLFELFGKAGPAIEHDGFGLGLAAVKLVMELHSGKAEVRNLPEGGASVSLYFPLKSELS